MRKIPVFCSMLVFIISCDQRADKTKPGEVIYQDTSKSTSRLPENDLVKIDFNQPGQRITVASNKITEVIGKKGIKITIDPSALETLNGAAPGSQIEIELKEITNQGELFRNDAPTTSDGKLLVSGGAYYISMTSDGNRLKVKQGRSVSIQIPRLTTNEMQLFYGEKDSNGILNWVAAGKKIIAEKEIAIAEKPATIKKEEVAKPVKDTAVQMSGLESLLRSGRNGRISAVEFKALAFTEGGNADTGKINNADFSTEFKETKDSATGKKTREIKYNYYNPFEITSLGWINCDRFYNRPDKSEIRCEFDSVQPISSAAIYVIFKNINSLQKEYVNKTSNELTVKLMNQYPAGEPVKLIAIANIGGRFYESKQDLVLQNKELVKFSFKPVNDKDVIKASYKY